MRPIILILLLSSTALAHPMGNFSINHHSTITVQGDAISIRYILDFAEIPTYQMFPQGTEAVPTLAEEWSRHLQLGFNGGATVIRLLNVRTTTSAGAGGLPTLKVIMDLSAPWNGQAGVLQYKDDNFPERIGWKEIVIQSNGEFKFPNGNAF